MSQENFAKQIGVNRNTYQSLELGRLALTKEVERKVFHATGAYRASMFFHLERDEPDFPVALAALRGKSVAPYSVDDYHDWLKRDAPGVPIHNPKELAEKFSKWAQLLFEAADSVKPSRLEQVFEHVCNSLNIARRDFGLEKSTNRILSGRQRNTVFRFTYGQMRRNADRAKRHKFKDKPYLSDDHPLEVVVTTTPEWNPTHEPPPN